ncbi:MAG: hypothetical protein ABWY05_02440 [Noviherbaspirillum sp.]
MDRNGFGSSRRAQAAAVPRDAARVIRIGRLVMLGALVPAAIWIGFAPITAVVVAPGVVRVDLNRRPVQHREGGIVKRVLVRDGQRVAAGQPVLVLGDIGVQADRNRLDYRAKVLRATLARLQAEELRAADLDFPPELEETARGDERLRETLRRERALYAARRATLHSELALMRAQRERMEHECLALGRQIAQMRAALALRQRNLEANRRLLDVLVKEKDVHGV